MSPQEFLFMLQIEDQEDRLEVSSFSASSYFLAYFYECAQVFSQ